MKKRIETKTVAREEDTEFFICEVCGKESISHYFINECEKKHKQEACKHENLIYSAETFETQYAVDFYSRCLDCDKKIEFYDIDFEKMNSYQLKPIIEAIRDFVNKK